jgi:hypothetical protein
MTDTERLQFLVRFAQLDLDTLRAGDWMNLREDLGWYLTGSLLGHRYDAGDVPVGGDMEIRPFDPPLPFEYPEDAFRALQREALGILTTLVKGKKPEGWEPTPPQFSRAEVISLDGLAADAGQALMLYEGPTFDAFVFRTQMLVIHNSTPYLRSCPECERIFYRVGKQQYCSRPCVNRATVRAWRQRPEVQ